MIFLNKEYCDFCGDETLHWKQGGNEVNIGEIGDGQAFHTPYKTICKKCLPIWNELTSKLENQVKSRRTLTITRESVGEHFSYANAGIDMEEPKPSLLERFWIWFCT